MFEVGTIIYFSPFYFNNGKSAPKPKYCIILKTPNDKTIIATLPTSKDSVPTNMSKQTGCIELPDINFNSFVFDCKTEVTVCGKCFNVETFVYGHQLEFYSIDLFKDLYRIEGTDFEIFGKMKPQLYQQLIECLKNSRAVKKKFIRHF